MRTFTATKRDDAQNIMRLELTGADIDLLTDVADRLDLLARIEKTLDVVSVQSPFILGTDTPTCTEEGAALLRQIINGWDPTDDGEAVELEA